MVEGGASALRQQDTPVPENDASSIRSDPGASQTDWSMIREAVHGDGETATEAWDQLAPVLRSFGQDVVRLAAPGAADADVLRHVLKVFLVDANGDVRNIYSTGFLDTRLILADVETLLGPLDPGEAH